jgi:hypothetical protein
MATRAEVIDKASILADDENDTQVTRTSKATLLNIAYKNVVKGFFVKSNDYYLATATIPYAAGVNSADFPVNARETALALYNENIIMTLQQKPFNPTRTGDPYFYKTVGREIQISPTPIEATSFTLQYYYIPQDMQTPTAEPVIPRGEENALIYALAAAIWKRKGEKQLEKDFRDMSQEVIDNWEPNEGSTARILTTDLHDIGNAAVPDDRQLLDYS